AACEDAYESERTGVLPLLDSARPGQLWMADRHFCTRSILERCQAARADFIVRQNARHPRIVHEGPWHDRGRVETGWVLEQDIHIDEGQAPWRRIELRLDRPTESGESVLWLWSSLPAGIGAQQIADLYRRR
ncbi:transposase, partial [Azotobacter beijerinckii]|uniref:transposase n=1 Tax=Azotobacter beijerinckii TaxID=170623 RepID=UPI002954383A